MNVGTGHFAVLTGTTARCGARTSSAKRLGVGTRDCALIESWRDLAEPRRHPTPRNTGAGARNGETANRRVRPFRARRPEPPARPREPAILPPCPLESDARPDRTGAFAGCPRARLERFVHDRYAEVYGARLTEFMPYILGILDPRGAPLAAIGLCPAERARLFLEQYLDRAVEDEIAATAGRRIPRETIIEIGNLATAHPGMLRPIIVAMTFFLHDAGFDWVVFTAVPSLKNNFVKLGLTLAEIAPADPARLRADRERWGSYYDTRPMVLAGRLRQAIDRFGSDPLVHSPS